VANNFVCLKCMPYEYNVPDGVGFWSGGLSDVSSGSHPTYSITVNDTSPIFFYWYLRPLDSLDRVMYT